MTICFPIIRRNELITGSGFYVRKALDKGFMVCTMHQLGMNNDDIGIVIPKNEGNVTRPQSYGILALPIVKASLEFCDPILDLALLSFVVPPGFQMANPLITEYYESLFVGQDVAVIGYPLSVIGSIIQTYEPCCVSAKVQREIISNAFVDEFIVNKTSFSGSSGSVVVDRKDNRILGMIRGCVAPPAMIQAGTLPLGTDTNITIAISSSNFFSTIIKIAGG